MSQRTGFVEIGKRFHRYVILRELQNKEKHHWVECQCDCGNIRSVRLANLQSGQIKSCGCFQKEGAARRLITHGQSKKGFETLAYRSWRAMLSRCNNPNDAGYPRYGAIGIRVCEPWQSFENFFTDMGARPSKEHTLDRYPDKKGNYEPKNCRWATWKEQGQNRSNNRFVTINGETHCITDWMKQFNINSHTLYERLKDGWSEEEALTTPVAFRKKWKTPGAVIISSRQRKETAMETEVSVEVKPKRKYTRGQPKSFLQSDLPRPRIAFVAEVAEAIGVSPLLILKWIREGKVKATKIGAQWRIPVTEVERLVRELEGAA